MSTTSGSTESTYRRAYWRAATTDETTPLPIVSRIATWNIRTMHEAGRTAQVAREMQRYRLDILGLAEVRWINVGRITLATGETLLYSCSSGDKARHRKRWWPIVVENAQKSLMEWESVSDRIITARFQSRFQNFVLAKLQARIMQRKDECPQRKRCFNTACIL